MKRIHYIYIAIAIVLISAILYIQEKKRNSVYVPSDIPGSKPVNNNTSIDPVPNTVSVIDKIAYSNKNDAPVYNSDWSLSKKAKINEFLGQIKGEQSIYMYKGINTVGKTVYFAKRDVK